MLQRLLQGGDLTEPGPVLLLGQACFGVAGHLLDARQLGGIDAQEPAPAAGVLVDTGRAVGSMARHDRSFATAGFRIVPVSEPHLASDTPTELLPAGLEVGQSFMCFLFFVLEAV